MKNYLIVILLLMTIFISSCSDDTSDTEGCTDPTAINYDPDAEENNGTCLYELLLTQSYLDSVNTLYKDGLTGDFVNANGDTIPLPRQGFLDVSSDSSIRDIYYSLSNQISNIQPGDIIVKRGYKKNPDGTKGELSKIFYMYKHPEGYFPNGGDWEYGVIGIGHVSNDHINGLLTDRPNDMYGKLTNCSSCHSKGGSDYLFTTDI